MRQQQRRSSDGRRDYIRVLRLLEKHTISQLSWAIEKALSLHLCSADAIIALADPLVCWSPGTFNLAGREHLQHVTVAACDVGAYSRLLQAAGVS